MRDGVPLLNGMVIDAELIPALAAYLQRVKLVIGNRDFDNGDVSASNPLPVAVMTPLSVTAGSPLPTIQYVQASDGVWLPLDGLPKSFGYDANGRLIPTLTAYNGTTDLKTDTWFNGQLSASTGWVLAGVQPNPPPRLSNQLSDSSGAPLFDQNGAPLTFTG